MEPRTTPPPPPEGTVQRWCLEFITSERLAHKLWPPPPPDASATAAWELAPPPRRLTRPGRPEALRVEAKAPRSPALEGLVDPAQRRRLLHTFVHHELQAAELFAWGILAFPDSPRAFRSGLLRLCCEELEHLHLYRAHLETLGGRFGALPVRDWFWQRAVACRDATSLVALLGLGLEGANLEHTERFAAAFRDAGDERGAAILERVQRDEIGHVAFARRWFAALTGAPLDYDRWRAALPAPLTPSMLQGRPLHRAAREAAGLDAAFLDRLAAEPPTTRARRAP